MEIKKEMILVILIISLVLFTGCSFCFKLPRFFVIQTEEGMAIKVTDWVMVTTCNVTVEFNNTEYKTEGEKIKDYWRNKTRVIKLDNSTTLINLNP